jgi:hypothetical protein
MFYKLIQRGLPGWFPYNSLHAMQPMFTRKMNETIAREIKTIDMYTLDGPSAPRHPVIVVKNKTVADVLKDQGSFKVVWAKALNAMFPGKRDFSTFMLGADLAANTAQRNLVGDTIYGFKDLKNALADFVAKVGAECLQAETLNLAKGLDQIDVIREYILPSYSLFPVLTKPKRGNPSQCSYAGSFVLPRHQVTREPRWNADYH